MNLFIFPYQSDNFYTCPDTAICKESGRYEYYVPDGIETVRAIPFAYVKISRAGKCIREEYAHKHYEVCGWGVHLATYDVNEGKTLDNSIFLSESTKIEGTGPFAAACASHSLIICVRYFRAKSVRWNIGLYLLSSVGRSRTSWSNLKLGIKWNVVCHKRKVISFFPIRDFG